MKYYLYRNRVSKNICLMAQTDDKKLLRFIKYLVVVTPQHMGFSEGSIFGRSLIESNIIGESDNFQEILGLAALEALV